MCLSSHRRRSSCRSRLIRLGVAEEPAFFAVLAFPLARPDPPPAPPARRLAAPAPAPARCATAPRRSCRPPSPDCHRPSPAALRPDIEASCCSSFRSFLSRPPKYRCRLDRLRRARKPGWSVSAISFGRYPICQATDCPAKKSQHQPNLQNAPRRSTHVGISMRREINLLGFGRHAWNPARTWQVAEQPLDHSIIGRNRPNVNSPKSVASSLAATSGSPRLSLSQRQTRLVGRQKSDPARIASSKPASRALIDRARRSPVRPRPASTARQPRAARRSAA